MNAESNNIKGLYVHVPFCDGKCFYCAFYSRPYQAGLADRYLNAIDLELRSFPPLTPETIYFGGGTPSVLSIADLQELCRIVIKNVATAALKEWTVEMNPGSLSAEKLAFLAKAGVNRVSLGAQSFNDQVLKWLGRRHSSADIHAAARMIKSAGFANFGIDLIACVPGFGQNVWRETLQSAVALNPNHISVYALTKEEGSRLARVIEDRQVNLLSEDEELEALDLAEKILASERYQRYEISNYSQAGFECLHNLACWRGEEYIGLGPAAASHAGRERRTNEPDLKAYLDAIENGRPPPFTRDIRTEKLKQIESAVFGLRMREGISEATAQPCRNTLLALRKEGLIELVNGRWRLTGRGINLADYVGAELLARENAE